MPVVRHRHEQNAQVIQDMTTSTMMLSPWKQSDYDRDVLQLPAGQSERDLEAQLETQAYEAGVAYEAPTLRRDACSSSGCSLSISSRSSFSGGSTDRTSLFSNDYPQPNSPSIDNASARQSIPSTSASSSRKSAFARFKSLGIRLHKSGRGEAESCAHCPKDAASRRRALHELPCGHHWCVQALRNLTVNAVRSQTPPACCQTRIPDRFVRHVLTGDELQFYEQHIASSMRDSIHILTPARTAPPRHREEYARFETWISHVKAGLNRQHNDLLQLLRDQHQKALDNQLEAQAVELTIAEDRQVKAEADLRALQQQEVKDNATALKHMEAYCAGHLSNGELHNRTITEQDLNELRKTQAVRDSMERKHSNAINILRGEQTRRLRFRTQRHDKDLHMLQSRQRGELLILEHKHHSTEAAFEIDCAEKWHRLCYRWHLQDTIQQRRLQVAAATAV